ncbi:MAG: metal/formaldehyde-sensitive transcriptional repressor [Candidatus Hydrogenedentes bacterium]|nr:metal/formaldehyde-sensitive transcriptional repressor [Candidatus Hydrogenedentota bacterium]
MSHTVQYKKKLLNRVRRIRGQVDAIAKALENEQECYDVLQTLAACRGAINGLMYEIVEGHLRFHVHAPGKKLTAEQEQATDQLLDVIRSYLK